ncbi:hypothetical protein [Priestia megaterium]|uniref:hypothetical protein n=1 Tax=Priestia megaterium TaxID=1404 RepID=UPI000BFDB1E4|nr:hypothetical protein [Priestia megaterium]PGO60633.1 hypothetical protein CN981_08775 [Priestia megaterium]
MKKSTKNQVDEIGYNEEYEELLEMEIEDADMDSRVNAIMGSRLEAEEVLSQLDHLHEENQRLKQLLKDNGIEA